MTNYNLVAEIAYSRFASYYSERNWLKNEPTWSQLTEEQKKFWIDLVTGVKTGFQDVSIATMKVEKAI